MALRGDELFLSYGVMGGFMQVGKVANMFTVKETESLESHKDMFRCY